MFKDVSSSSSDLQLELFQTLTLLRQELLLLAAAQGKLKGTGPEKVVSFVCKKS